MLSAVTGRRLANALMSIVRPVGEFIHVSAIYLGIAVLTTLGLSLVLPSMREQSRQLHEVVLTMFQTDGEGYAAMDESLSDPDAVDWAMPVPSPSTPAGEAGTDATPAGDAGEAGTTPPTEGVAAAPDSEGPAAAPLMNFSVALDAAIRGQPIPGLTQAQAQALRSYLARKYKIANSVAGALVRIVFTIGPAKNLDPQLLLAVIAIESRYNPFAESSVGAQGLMQIMTRVHLDKLQNTGGGAASVFNPAVNIEVGAQILSDCIRRRGSLTGGLACYVGATGPSDGGYGARVLAEQRRIALASGIAPGRR